MVINQPRIAQKVLEKVTKKMSTIFQSHNNFFMQTIFENNMQIFSCGQALEKPCYSKNLVRFRMSKKSSTQNTRIEAPHGFQFSGCRPQKGADKSLKQGSFRPMSPISE